MAGQDARRGVWLVAAALFAALYVALAGSIAVDRAAASRPELADWVPGAFRQNSLTSTGERLILAGTPAQALPLAERLVARDPLAPQAAGLLGTGRLARGDVAGATTAFRLSAKLGWRDAATQVFWFDAALRAKDYNLAATRFGAIARQWPYAEAIDQLSARLESDPRGLAMLAQEIASGEKWAVAYATPQAFLPVDRLAGRARVLVAAGAIGGKLGCSAIAPLVGTLQERRQALAGELWSRQCARAAAPGQLADGGFEAQPAPPPLSVFDWQFPGNGALDAAVVADSRNGKALRLSTSAATMVPVAAQRVVLGPGSYSVSWSEAGAGPARIAASLSCSADRSAADPRQGDGTAGRRAVTLKASDECEAPLLQLWLRPGRGEVTIDDVAISAR
jgi:hypothetical protein